MVKEVSQNGQLILDCSELEFIDSSGIGMIMKLFNQLKTGSGSLFVIKPNDELDASVLEEFLVHKSDGHQSQVFDTVAECDTFLEKLSAS